MRVIHVTREARVDSQASYPVAGDRTGATRPVFIGDVDGQTVLGDENEVRVLEVHFKNGARNRLHAHSTDQILIVTEGEGIVATREHEERITVGDIAFIPANEPHWHGALPGRELTHWAINRGGTSTTIVE